MAKSGKRGREDIDTYDSDDGFVENDSGNAPKAKKTKNTQTIQREQANDNKFWELSSGKNPRRIEISEFKNTKLVNIREFYEKDGDYLPGKKGISLSIDQYKALLKAIPALNARLEDLGVDIGVAHIRDDSEAERKPHRRTKAKKEEKSNIEATSEEDEE